jgi:DNA-binding NtrC family response regulator
MSPPPRDVLIVAKFGCVGQLVDDIFNGAGYRCRVAGDAGEALEMFRQSRPALVVSDLRMPGMSVSGVELLTQSLREDLEVAVVFLTGDPAGSIVTNCLRLGAFKVLPKPTQVDQLLMTAERALERRQLLSERHQYKAALDLLARS